MHGWRIPGMYTRYVFKSFASKTITVKFDLSDTPVHAQNMECDVQSPTLYCGLLQFYLRKEMFSMVKHTKCTRFSGVKVAQTDTICALGVCLVPPQHQRKT